MKRIAKFHKVSKERFTADWIDTFAQSQEEAEKVYEAIRLPKRATAGSAGYDFFAPAEFTLKPGETVIISIQITKATFFQRSQMIPMKTKLLQSRQIQDSCRESL